MKRPCLKYITIKNLTYYQLFIIYEIILFLTFNIINLIYHGFFASNLFLNLFNRFTDYFMHIGYASAPIGTNIYAFDTNVCFPPLAYLMYAFLARTVGYRAEDPTVATSHQFVGHNLSIYVIYTCICIILLVYAVSLFIKKGNFINRVLLPCILIVTYPVAFAAIQRGNSALLVAPLIAIALSWRNDKSKIKKEAAMILIAVCAGFKIYPAILGLLYIKEKRFKETFRLLIYGVILFFVPFVFWGGLEGIKSFFNTLLFLNGDIHRCSVSGLTEEITRNLFGSTIRAFTMVIQNLFLVLCLTSFFMSKTRRGEILVLCALMTVYISSSWMYTCVYMIPVLLVFFNEKQDQSIRINKRNWTDILIMLLLCATFSFTFNLDFPFIYDCITIITAIYCIYTILYFLYQKAYMKLSTNNSVSIQ